MRDRYQIRMAIIELIDQNPLNNVDIAPIIEKFTAGENIDEQGLIRLTIENVLLEMREEGELTFPDSGISITGRSGYEFFRSSGFIRSTMKYEKEKKKESEKVASTFYVGGNVAGNINTGSVAGNLTQQNFGDISINSNHERELASLGVQQNEIDDLKEIVTTSKDKATVTSKVMKWLGSVSASIAGRGLYENIPALTDLIHRITS